MGFSEKNNFLYHDDEVIEYQVIHLDRTKLLAAGGSETFGAGSLKILYFKVKSFPESGLKISSTNLMELFSQRDNFIHFRRRDR